MRAKLITLVLICFVVILGDGVAKASTVEGYEQAALDANLYDCRQLEHLQAIRAKMRRMRGVLNIHDMNPREILLLCGDICKGIRKDYPYLTSPTVWILLRIEHRAKRMK